VKRAATETILGSVVEKPLLRLHAAARLEPFWIAVQRVIEAVLPGSLVGLTLQHHPISPLIAKWSRPILNGSFNARSIEIYLSKHPRNRRFVRASDVFPKRDAMLQSDFYRKYMAPQKRSHAIGLFFWQRQRLLAIIVIMRTAEQGDFTSVQTKLLRHLYSQFETALRRLQLLERERAARTALEGFLSRLPLPTMLLRWNLRLVYQNKAAREFCNLWAVGPELAVLALPAFFVDFRSGFCGEGCGDWANATPAMSNSIPTKDKTDLCNRYLRIRNSLLSQNMPLYKTDWDERRWH